MLFSGVFDSSRLVNYPIRRIMSCHILIICRIGFTAVLASIYSISGSRTSRLGYIGNIAVIDFIGVIADIFIITIFTLIHRISESRASRSSYSLCIIVSSFVNIVSLVAIAAAFTGINWIKDSAYALADRITRDVNKYAMGLFNTTNVTLSATLDVSSKATVASLYKTAADNDIPVDRAVVILGPTDFAKVLAMVDYNMVGSGDYIKTGVI